MNMRMFMSATLALLIAACAQSTPTGQNQTQIATGTLPSNIVLGQVTKANAPLAALAADTNTKERVAVSKDISTGKIDGIIYSCPTGNQLLVKSDSQGLPTSIEFKTGEKITLTNYTPSTVDITVYDALGTIVSGPLAQAFNAADINAMKSAFTSINLPAYGAIVDSPNAAATIKWGAVILNWAGCAGSFFTGAGSAYLSTVLSCGSAILSTFAAIGNDPTLNKVATMVDTASCAVGTATLDFIKAASCAVPVLDTLIANSGLPGAKIISPAYGLSTPVNTTVTFNGSQAGNYTSPVKSYTWDFGDLTNGTGSKVTHTYASAKLHTVTLTVTFMEGSTLILRTHLKRGIVCR